MAILLVVAGDGVFPLLPGETAIVAGAVLAAEGRISLAAVIAAGTIGAVMGDSTAFAAGSLGGGRLRARVVRMAGSERVDEVEGILARRGPSLVVMGRFLPGLRIAINMACGAGAMRYRRFLGFDTLGALLWTAQAALIGYAFGRIFEERPWIGFAIAIAVTIAIGSVVVLRERRHAARQS